METSKVTKVEFKDSFNSDYGTLHSFAVEFENGDRGFYNSKSKDQNKFVEGSPADYDKEEKQGKNGTYYKIKPAKKEFSSNGSSYSGGAKKSSNASFALSYAKDLGIANIAQGKDVKSNHVTEIAEHFLNWLNAHE